MVLYNQLNSILHIHSYNTITFYMNQIPIITLHLDHHTNTITVITNNMQEMNSHTFNYSDNVIVDIDNALIDDGIYELLMHNQNASITFHALFLSGTINSHQVQLEQLEFVGSDDNTHYVTYTFPINNISLEILEIIASFIHVYFI